MPARREAHSLPMAGWDDELWDISGREVRSKNHLMHPRFREDREFRFGARIEMIDLDMLQPMKA